MWKKWIIEAWNDSFSSFNAKIQINKARNANVSSTCNTDEQHLHCVCTKIARTHSYVNAPWLEPYFTCSHVTLGNGTRLQPRPLARAYTSETVGKSTGDEAVTDRWARVTRFREKGEPRIMIDLLHCMPSFWLSGIWNEFAFEFALRVPKCAWTTPRKVLGFPCQRASCAQYGKTAFLTKLRSNWQVTVTTE